MSKAIDFTGKTFGYLTVIERCGSNKKGKALWRCKCKCGNECLVSSEGFRQGTESCGCKRYESKNKTHGMRHTKIYEKWCGMKQRCDNPNSTAYKNYGAVGVHVCPEWENSFELFMKWSYAHGYKDGLSLDRIDNEKGYSPDNCRWVEWPEQSRNRRNNLIVEWNGEKRLLKDWCTQYGKNYSSVRQRMKRDGYTFEEAMFSKPYELRGRNK